jgi:uncharacterized protein YecE (DUF72 family)
MSPSLYVGCPMWAHRPWVGRHLPTTTPQGRELEAYGHVVNAVEGNTTFYALPSAETVDRWAGQVDETFRFVFKLPRVITHDRRLRDVDGLVASFVELVAPLGPRIGGLTFQLPASFAPSDLAAIDAVLARAPQGVRWSVEVRHPDFFDEPARSDLDRVLDRHGAERVLLDSRALFSVPPRSEAGREAWGKKPRVPALADPVGDQPIVRFIGSDDPDVTAAALAEWVPIVADWVEEGRTPTFFVHTPDNLDSPSSARDFHAAVRQLRPELLALPTPLPLEPVEQQTLF